jgi:hypothetical protein
MIPIGGVPWRNHRHKVCAALVRLAKTSLEATHASPAKSPNTAPNLTPLVSCTHAAHVWRPQAAVGGAGRVFQRAGDRVRGAGRAARLGARTACSGGTGAGASGGSQRRRRQRRARVAHRVRRPVDVDARVRPRAQHGVLCARARGQRRWRRAVERGARCDDGAAPALPSRVRVRGRVRHGQQQQWQCGCCGCCPTRRVGASVVGAARARGRLRAGGLVRGRRGRRALRRHGSSDCTDCCVRRPC